MPDQKKMSRVDYKDIWSLDKLLPAERLRTPEECIAVLNSCLDFVAWDVLDRQVILLTESSRILFTVQEENPNIVQADCFPNEVDWDDDPCMKTFTLHKKYLKGIRMRILARPDIQKSFTYITNGLCAEIPDE